MTAYKSKKKHMDLDTTDTEQEVGSSTEKTQWIVQLPWNSLGKQDFLFV